MLIYLDALGITNTDIAAMTVVLGIIYTANSVLFRNNTNNSDITLLKGEVASLKDKATTHHFEIIRIENESKSAWKEQNLKLTLSLEGIQKQLTKIEDTLEKKLGV